MQALLTHYGAQALRVLIRDGALLGFDFDGTLAPTVAHPPDAGMLPAVSRKFGEICKATVVAVVTGRSVADAQRRFATLPTYLIGNHGAEGLPWTDACRQDESPHICGQWALQLESMLSRHESIPGLYVEHKPCSICIHYRHVVRADITDMLSRLLEKLVPKPRILQGTLAVNLVAADAPTKLDALETLVRLQGIRGAFFVGDEETDELVFRGAPSHWVTVRVGRSQDSAAQFFLEDQAEIEACLHLLSDILEEVRRS